MILNILLLCTTIFLIYIGYTYKAIILFIFSMLFKDAYGLYYNYTNPKLKFREDRKAYTLNFFLEDEEYTLTIPVEELKNRDKILAISGSSNKTKYILKCMGPYKNFFGMNISPKHLGLEKVTIWKNKSKYIFSDDEFINFKNYDFSKNKVDYSDSSDHTE